MQIFIIKAFCFLKTLKFSEFIISILILKTLTLTFIIWSLGQKDLYKFKKIPLKMLNPIKTKSNKLAVVADKSEIKNKVFDKIQDSLYKGKVK